MKTNHTKGKWQIINRPAFTEITVGTKDLYICTVLSIDIEDEEAEANAELIAAAPELLQMVYNLKNCIKRLTQDNLTQFEKDTEAQWEGEAHELLVRINPNYYSNANEATI